MRFIRAIILVILAFIGGCLFDGLITYVPQDALTKNAIEGVERGIRKYYKAKGFLPKDVDALREFLGEGDDFAINAWAIPIMYVSTNETSVTLSTYGPGGKSARIRQEFIRQFDVSKER